jgi:hypothetical protein
MLNVKPTDGTRGWLTVAKPKNGNKKAGRLRFPAFFSRTWSDRSKYVPGCGKR